MDIKEKLEICKRNCEEVLNEQELEKVLKKKEPRVYCGYEVSGDVHLGHFVTITKLMDLERAGFKVVVLFADWHTWLNRKGDWDFIHNETKKWQKVFKSAGLKNAEFVLGSSFERNLDYIDDVLIMSLKTTINRAVRSMQMVARDIENAKVSQVIYPFMQIEDIKTLNLDAVVSGIDQRKIHAMGLELFDEIKFKKPVFFHTSLIPSLKGPGKMSSSIPDSLVSLNDTDKDIEKKINNAYCPLNVEENSVLAIVKLIVFPRVKEFLIKRAEKFGGDIKFNNYKDLEKEFLDKKLHAQDLKKAVSEYLIEILTPIRKTFHGKT